MVVFRCVCGANMFQVWVTSDYRNFFGRNIYFSHTIKCIVPFLGNILFNFKRHAIIFTTLYFKKLKSIGVYFALTRTEQTSKRYPLNAPSSSDSLTYSNKAGHCSQHNDWLTRSYHQCRAVFLKHRNRFSTLQFSDMFTSHCQLLTR